ncbi:MAG: hypothetical protein K2X60_07175 [Xanthobacteraceae bacterium]|nr:hypothetical protein [Xanthobacteraceae bacterium]
MKKLTCKDLGGVCDEAFVGTFEEIGQKCRVHVMEAVQRGDAAHQAAAGKFMTASPMEQAEMMLEFKNRFDAAPDV